MRFRKAIVSGVGIVTALACGTVLAARQQPAAPAGQPPAAGQPAGQQPAGTPGQGRGRGGGFRQPDPIDFQEHDGWTPLFDGKTLNGWSGDSNWKVEDGAIV